MSRKPTRKEDANSSFPTDTPDMCRAREQNASIYGANAKAIKSLEPPPEPPAHVPDTPTERLSAVLRKRTRARSC